MIPLIVDMPVDHVAALFVNDRIMAEENVVCAVVDLKKIRHALAVVQQPFRMGQTGIVIAADEMELSVQTGKILRRRFAVVVGEVADDIDGVVRADAGVPIRDQRLVHLRDARKRARRVVQDRKIAEMQIGGIEDHRTRSPFAKQRLFGRAARSRRHVQPDRAVMLCF